MSESKLWGEVFSVIQNPKSAEELYRESVLAIIAPITAAVAAADAIPLELQKRQPRFDSIRGDGNLEITLFPEITRVKNSLNNPMNGYGIMSGPAQVRYITEMFKGKLAGWWSNQIKDAADDPSLIPNSVDALVARIKTSYCIRDYEVKHLTGLFALKQTSNTALGLQSYATEFNRYMDSWNDQMEWKLQAYWFIMGLSNVTIRSDLFAKLKTGDFDKFPKKTRLAQLLNTAATCALNRSDGASGSGSKRPADTDSNSGGDGSKNDGKPKGKKKKGNGNNGKGGKEQHGKQFDKDERNRIMSSQVYKDTCDKLKKAMTKEEFDRHCKGKLCLCCHNKGHMLWQCKRCPEIQNL